MTAEDLQGPPWPQELLGQAHPKAGSGTEKHQPYTHILFALWGSYQHSSCSVTGMRMWLQSALQMQKGDLKAHLSPFNWEWLNINQKEAPLILTWIYKYDAASQ